MNIDERESRMRSDDGAAEERYARVWDVPTRVVHWLIVILIAISWRSAENHAMELHRFSGYGLLGVLAFRLYWGFAGSTTARFAQFIRGPRHTWSYARTLLHRKRAAASPGHNPLGAWSVVALLALLMTQVVLGLFAVDVDGIESGPLSAFVSFDTGRALAELHEQVFDVLLAFIGLHLAAVLFYWFVRQQNLIAPMFHGKAPWPPARTAPLQFASSARAVLGVALAALVVWLVARGA
jgi:cytochrome b